jgi:hypothetical protein
MERDGAPAGQEGAREVSPQLMAVLAGLDPAALQAIIEVIALHREYPAWAVWMPDRGRPWIAVRPASARVPGPEVPMIWAGAVTAAELGDRMRRADGVIAGLSPGAGWLVAQPPGDLRRLFSRRLDRPADAGEPGGGAARQVPACRDASVWRVANYRCPVAS